MGAQVIISQYYEGSGTNKWIELTNMSSSSINTASPQLKLGLWDFLEVREYEIFTKVNVKR